MTTIEIANNVEAMADALRKLAMKEPRQQLAAALLNESLECQSVADRLRRLAKMPTVKKL